MRKYTPTFYREVNTPMNIKGMNPNGMVPSLIFSVVCAGLGIWLPIVPILMFGLWLSRKLGKEPNYHREVADHVLNGHRWATHKEKAEELISFIASNGEMLSLANWGQRGFRAE
jgi:hypothetical protein